MQIITCQEAKAAGLNKYYTGKLCKHGHDEPRSIYSNSCIGCIREFGHRWYKEKREHKLEKSRKIYLKNKKNILIRTGQYQKNNREKVRVWAKKWRNAHPKKALDACRSYRERHPGKYAEYQRVLRKKNPERYKAYVRNRLALKKLAGGSHTADDVLSRLKWQKRQCAACNKRLKIKFHVDHYIPITKGGSNYPSNLQILCPKCNQTKSNRDPIEFYQSIGLLL